MSTNTVEHLLEVADLDDRYRDIMKLLLGLKDNRSYTYSEVSLCFNVSRERIRQIEYNALRKMMRAAAEEDDGLDIQA